MNAIIGSSIVRIVATDSTNNYANSQIRENVVPEGTVFLTYDQTAGRGQMNNSWESEPGQNLTFSVVLYPDFLEIRNQFMISKIITLGIYSALSMHVTNLRIKWPNDIYAGNKKLGGILIENSIMSGLIKTSVCGIGLNLNQTIFRSDAPNPVSLKILTNKHYDCDSILTEILTATDYFYSVLREGRFNRIDQDFHSLLYQLNEFHSYRSKDKVFQGKIVGVNEIGQLQIETPEHEILEFHFKEVEFL